MPILNIKASYLLQDGTNFLAKYQTANEEFVGMGMIRSVGCTIGTDDPSNFVFSNPNDAVDYFYAANAADLVSTINSIVTPITYTLGTRVIVDDSVTVKLDTKVDKVSGKGLSANDYTTIEKSKLAAISTQTHIADAANNAATNAPTNLNVLTTLLGTLTGEVNATNTKQNDLATKYNDLATKFNTLLDKLEANALLATS